MWQYSDQLEAIMFKVGDLLAAVAIKLPKVVLHGEDDIKIKQTKQNTRQKIFIVVTKVWVFLRDLNRFSAGECLSFVNEERTFQFN